MERTIIRVLDVHKDIEGIDWDLMSLDSQRGERCDEPGLLNVPDEDEWEPHDDDVVSARTLMKRIEIVLRDFASSPGSDSETAEAD